MKAASFRYEKVSTLVEAIDLLARHEGAAVPLAGGQSLIATLNLRLSMPELLVDITGIEELRGISCANGIVRIGALTRHVEVLNSDIVKAQLPLMREAVTHVAHAAIRNRGTIGGSVAYGDPAAELPTCIVALDATIVIEGLKGRRTIAARDFYSGLFSTDISPDELIVEFLVPVQSPPQRWSFLELSRRRGDFALAGIAMTAAVESDRVEAATVVYFGCSDYPAVAQPISAEIARWCVTNADLDWVDDIVRASLSVQDTPGYRADTKLQLATVLTKRALRQIADSDRVFCDPRQDH